MARIDGSYAPAFQPKEIQTKKFQGSFSNKSHDFYIVYDDVMDQLTIRLVPPTTFVSEYFVSAETGFALLISERGKQVVGFTMVNFQSDYLPKIPKLNALWTQNKLAENFQKYRKFRYDPQLDKSSERTQVLARRISAYSANECKAASVLAAA